MSLLNYHGLNLHTIHAADTDGKVITLKLCPGINEADAETWSVAKTHPLVKADLLAKRIEELDAASDNVADMEEAKALELIGETVAPELLAKWKASEKRPNVLKALDAQLDKIDPTKDKKDDGKKDADKK